MPTTVLLSGTPLGHKPSGTTKDKMAWILPFKEEGDADERNLYIAYNQLAIQIGKYVDFFNAWYNDVIDPSNNLGPRNNPILPYETYNDTIGQKLYPRYGIESNPFDNAPDYQSWKDNLPWDLYGDEEPRTVVTGGVQLSLPLRRYLGPVGWTYATYPGVSSMIPYIDFYHKEEKKYWVLRPRRADGMKTLEGSSSASPYRALFLKVNQYDTIKGVTMETIVWPDQVGVDRSKLQVAWKDKRISTQNYKDEYFDATIEGLGDEISQGEVFCAPHMSNPYYSFGELAHQPHVTPQPGGGDKPQAGGQPFPYGWINPGWLNLQVTLINLFGGKRGKPISQIDGEGTSGFSVGSEAEGRTLLAPLQYDRFEVGEEGSLGVLDATNLGPNGDGSPFAAHAGFGEWNDGYFSLRERANTYIYQAFQDYNDLHGTELSPIGLFYVGDYQGTPASPIAGGSVVEYRSTYKQEDAINYGAGCAPFSIDKNLFPEMGFVDDSDKYIQGVSLLNQMWAICMVFEQEAAYLNVGMGSPDPTEFCCEGGLPVPGQDPAPESGFCDDKADGCHTDPNLPYVQPDPPNVPIYNAEEGMALLDNTQVQITPTFDNADCAGDGDVPSLITQLTNSLDLRDEDGNQVVISEEEAQDAQRDGEAEVTSDGTSVEGTRTQFNNQLEDKPRTFGTIREGVAITIVKTCNQDETEEKFLPADVTVTQTQTIFQFFARFNGCCDAPGGVDLKIFRHVTGGEDDLSSFFIPLGTGSPMDREDFTSGDIITVEEFKNNTDDTVTFVEFPHMVNYSGDTENVGRGGGEVDISDVAMSYEYRCQGGLPVNGNWGPDVPVGFCAARGNGTYYVKKGTEKTPFGRMASFPNGDAELTCGSAIKGIEALTGIDLECEEIITLEIYFDPYVLGRKAVSSGVSAYGEPPNDGRSTD